MVRGGGTMGVIVKCSHPRAALCHTTSGRSLMRAGLAEIRGGGHKCTAILDFKKKRGKYSSSARYT